MGYAGDGGPALQAQFRTVQDIELGPDGSLYVLDRERVRRITPDGIIRTVAGDTIKGYAGDDGPALQARFFDPGGIAVGRDGTIYIADTYNERVRAVMPDGYIHTIAGTGVYACRPIVDDCGDGGPALQARFGYILDVAVAPDGSIYTGEYSRIRRIGPDGIVTRVLGGAYCNYPNCGDGGPAVAATVTQVERINFAADGSLLLVDAGGEIRRIDASGIVRNIAGYAAINVPHAPYGEGMPATAFWMGGPESVAGAPDGSVYFAYGSLLYRIAAPLPGFTNSDLGVPSASGTELYRFDRYGRHLSTIDMRTGATLLTFAYDSVGRLLSMTDASGNATSIERGGAGRPTALVGPYGQRTGLAVDDDGNLTRIVNPAGEAIDLTYVSGGLLATYTDPRRQVHRFDYDGAGRLIKDSNPAGGFTTLAREERLDASYTVTTTTAEGVTNSYSSTFPASGNILRTSQSAGEAATQTTEQTDGGVITRAPDGTVTTTWLAADPYFGLAAPFVGASKVTTPAGLTLNMAATRTKYGTGGPFGYAFQLDSMRVNGRLSRTLTDLVNRVVTTTSPEGRQIISMIDAGGRPLVDSIPELLGMHYTYDTQGRLSTVGSGSLLTQVTYDGQGRPTTVIDPAGGKESYAYDGADRLIRRVLADSTAIEFAYDSAGNLTLVRPAGRPATNLKYSPVDLLWEFAQPPAAAGEPPLRFTYNGDRTLASMTRASGVTLRFGHDATGEISSVTYAGDQRTYVHEPTTGMLISLNNSAEQLAFAYDGSLLTRTTWSGAATGALTVAYDSLFRPASFTVNSLEPVVFAYDRDGLLTSAGALTVTRDVRNGAIVGSTLGDVTTAMAYDTLGLPRTYSASYSGALIFSRNYTRDRLGRVAALTETAQNDTTVLGYEYDALGRLQTVSRNGAAIASYEYDAAGNRIRLTTPQGQIAGTYDTQDRLLSYGDVTYGYDADGNRTLRVVGSDTTSYTYDGMALLTGVVLPRGHRVRYTYDGRGRRIAQSIDGVVARKWLYFDQVHPAAELNPADSIVARFVYDGDADVPAYMLKDGRTYRLITDQVGSVRLVMDVATGEVKQRLDYDEYGGVTRNTNPGFQPFGFAGGMQDEETGMVHFGARDYDPSVGRWLVKDPALLGGGGPNLYVYVENDPQNRADPSGGQTEIYDAAAAQFEAIYLIADYYRRDGHRRWPGERNSDLRHFCTSYKLTQILGPELTELFGLLNEAEGFLWQDLRHLRSRIRNHTPWAFQLADIRANERGIQEALRRRHANTCPADPSECQ